MTSRSLRDHGRGALLGTALGDAVGAPFEGHASPTRTAVEEWLEDRAPLSWTDDTAMTVALARALVATGGRVDPQQLGDTFAATYHAEPWRGYGAGPPTVFAAAAEGTPYVEAAAALFGGSGSFGNGAAMRVAPVALVGRHDDERVARLAREQSLVTHAHPVAEDGAVAVALLVAKLVIDPQDPPVDAVATLLAHLETAEMRAGLEAAIACRDETDPQAVAARLGNGVAAADAVPAAVAAFLGAPDDPTSTLLRAVTMGGDTDTIAAMAGAMAGARVGAAALPAALLTRLEARDELVALADRLLDLDLAGTS